MAVFHVNKRYHKKYSFRVEIPGFGDAFFMACSAIKPEVAKIEHWEGGSIAPHLSLGRYKHPDLTLRRGVTDSLDFYNWFKQGCDASAMVDDDQLPRQIDVIELDRRQKEVRRWALWECIPLSYQAGDWDNNSDENTVEELVVAVRFATLGGDNQP